MTGATETNSQLEHLFFWGRPLSPLYSCLMANRSRLYRNGFFRQEKLAVPVISVGNLVLGGTGKTPLVLYIAEFLRAKNKKPAILSRGYKGTASGTINVVSDGKTILLDAGSAGDEPRLLAEKLPGTPIIIGKKRSVTGRFALDSFDIDHLILDDGFQHLAIKRDLDLVLFNAEKLLGNGRVLPGGELREPLSALTRADAFILTGSVASQNAKVKEFLGLLNSMFPDKPVFSGSYMIEESMIRISAGKVDSLGLADGRKMPLYGFCGIARPASFYNTLQKAGLQIAGFQTFRDHHIYSAEDITELCRNGKTAGARALVTTEKDLVKVRDLFPQDFPLLTLPVRLLMEKNFDQFLKERLNGFQAASA